MGWQYSYKSNLEQMHYPAPEIIVPHRGLVRTIYMVRTNKMEYYYTQ